MGGLALKHVEGIRRYSKDEFFSLADRLIPQVSECLNTKVELVKSYHLKESFGDMDLIVLNSGNLSDAKSVGEIIQKNFNPTDIHYNGNVHSFDFEGLQIDLIITPTSNWETSQVFFAYNDLGNLMGKIYHKFGLKYGYDGLKYIYRLDNEKKLGDITVTKNMPKAFEFIGLSYEQFEKGFDTVEDIFNFVVESPYFQKEAFYFENLNAINKKRNKRRANYKLFLEFVNGTGEYKGRSPLPDKPFQFETDKSKYFQMINDFFPESDFLNQMEILRKKEERKKLIHSKFNGNLIMQKYSDLSGKNLGFVMGAFACKFTDFDSYILHTNEEDIWKDFTSVYKTLAI
jgi:hypothetical protein